MPVTPQPQAAMHRTILQRRRTAASLPLFTPRGPSLEAYRFLEGIRELGASNWSPLLNTSTTCRKTGEIQLHRELFPGHETNSSKA
ncbi:hypothetical protein N7490_006519 [Penicillium lividum]|nr:hypothetical protein N7490_006519 [Penicillium lividum]